MPQATTELWSLGGISMSVEKDSSDTPIMRMGELGPLDSSKTILHYGGTESYDRELTAVMWNYSGYVNTFMPLIGSGYHALVSDDGAQGDYFIQSCKPERLNDFISCSGNSPVRINIQLKKASKLTWPMDVYFCGRGTGAGGDKGGVWKTSDFTDPDTATQPTWTKLSITGSWPADNYILAFGIDVSNPNEYVYALTLTGRDVLRYSVTGGTWTTILASADVTGIIIDMMIDKATGYLFALSYNSANPSSRHYLHRCTAPAAGVPAWGTVTSAGYWVRGVGNLWVYNDSATYLFTADPTGYDHYIDVSNGGGAWSRTEMSTIVGNVGIGHFRNRDSIDVYTTWNTGQKLNHWQIGDPSSSGPSYVCSAASPQDVWSGGTYYAPRDLFMPSPSDSSILRFVPKTGALAGHLLTTTDKFQTYTDQGRLDIGTNPGPVNRVVSSIVETVDESNYGMILYGATDPAGGNEHTIYAAYGSTDTTPEGKSGAYPDTGVDSIHYLASGPCRRGIQVV